MTSYEHHSNILPWVEFYENVNVLDHNEGHDLLLDKIYQQLLNCPKKDIIVSVSAASNVTSRITPLGELNKIISNWFLIIEKIKK